jgi:hypothetical protein
MFNGLPGGSGQPSQVRSWLYVLFIGIGALFMVGMLVRVMWHAVDTIETTRPARPLTM